MTNEPTKHTPGTWSLERNGPCYNLKSPDRASHFLILVAMTSNAPGEFEANSVLISSAPDLLKACQRYRDACSCQSGGFDGEGVCAQPCDLCDFASAAIAKATVQNPPQTSQTEDQP